MCRDHVICTARGHMTSKPCEPTDVGACRARIASHVSHPVRELAELANHSLYKQRGFPYGILIFNSYCDPDY